MENVKCDMFDGMIYKSLLSLLIIIFPFNLEAQIFSDEDVDICNSKFELAVDKNLSSQPIGEVMIEIGKSFLGTDYEAHTLEKDGDEQLVIDLTGLDCTTFLENVLVFARCIKKREITFNDYINELEFIRYRNGVIDQYPSRLHYFTDWIYDNEKKGVVKDITKEIGGEELKLNLNFMSSHPEYYRQLKDNPDFVCAIKEQEKEINKREHYFIPQNNISAIDDKIENGDLLAFTSSIKGLDVNHVGIAIRMDDGKIHVLHAPMPGTKVQISELNLSVYVNKLEKDTGIIVIKVIEPVN